MWHILAESENTKITTNVVFYKYHLGVNILNLQYFLIFTPPGEQIHLWNPKEVK
jgi:hypothetical protein